MNPYQILFWFLFLFMIMIWLFPKTMRALRQWAFNRTINAIYGKQLSKHTGIPLDKLYGLEVGLISAEVIQDHPDKTAIDVANAIREMSDKLVNDLVYDSLEDKERFK